MAYGDFSSQVGQRGASAINRSRQTKAMTFEYLGEKWLCQATAVGPMTQELADGYEMAYCLGLYCERVEKSDS